MSLKETIEKTKEQLEKAIETETKEQETALEQLSKTVDEAIVEEKPVEAKDEPKPEEKPEEKPEIKAEEEPVKTNADKAAERVAKKREKDRLAEELAAANERIAALEASAKKPEDVRQPYVDAEPNPVTNPIDHLAWQNRQLKQKVDQIEGWKAEQETVKSRDNLKERAQREVQVYENQLRTSAPDYDDVKTYYANMLAASIKIVNPRITDQQLSDAVTNRLLTRASELLAEGYENPIEAMYLEAKSLGYKPKEAAKEEKEQPKPDMDKVAKFRSRNSGMAGASGSGGDSGDVSASVAVKMTNAEFARLKPEQKKRMFNALRG